MPSLSQESSGEARSWRPRETIDITRPADVRYWSQRLGVTAEELTDLVDEFGDRAAAVATAAGVVLGR